VYNRSADKSLARPGRKRLTGYLQPRRNVLATQKKLAYLGFQCLDHPPYSPDLAPSDYHLFPGLKKKIEKEVGRAKDLSALQYNDGFEKESAISINFQFHLLSLLPYRHTY
jgi:histone-lysine N-methyltransferase SETMAR